MVYSNPKFGIGHNFLFSGKDHMHENRLLSKLSGSGIPGVLFTTGCAQW